MSRQEIYRLRLLSPLHLGQQGTGMEETSETIPSDTLFSALCWGLREVEGDGWLEDWLGAFLGGPAPFLLTSAFPRIGELLFYPRPMLATDWSGTGLAGDSPAATLGKRLKKTGYVSSGLFRSWLTGETLDAEMRAENFLPGGLWTSNAERGRLPASWAGPWAREASVPHVALDRASNAGSLYQVGEVHYQQDCGLWFGVRWREEGWRELLEAALSCLGEAGIGGERSAGRGQFSWTREPVDDLPAPQVGARHAVTLSLYHPRLDEVEAGALEEASYRLTTRRGWISSMPGQGLRGKAVRMLSEGSVIAGVGTVGELVDVTPDGFDAHRVYRYGLAFPVEVGGG